MITKIYLEYLENKHMSQLLSHHLEASTACTDCTGDPTYFAIVNGRPARATICRSRCCPLNICGGMADFCFIHYL